MLNLKWVLNERKNEQEKLKKVSEKKRMIDRNVNMKNLKGKKK